MSGGAGVPAAQQAGNPRVGEHGALSCGRELTFSAESRKEVDRLLTRYPDKQSALLPVLWVAQKEWGWISREAVDHVASVLGLSPAFVSSASRVEPQQVLRSSEAVRRPPPLLTGAE